MTSPDPRYAKPTGAIVLGGDYQGLGIARSLGRHNVPVVVIDDERSIAKVSRYVKRTIRVDSLRDERSTLAALELAKRKHGLDGWVLFPTREENVAALARNRLDLSTSFRVPTPSWECIRHSCDKRQTYALASRLGIAMARTWFPADESALDEIDVTRPVIVKPAIKEHFFYATREKAWRADTKEELRDKYRKASEIVGDSGEVIVQELVLGDGENQFSYCAFFKAGRPMAEMTVRRTRQHPSDFGRASTFVETMDVPEIIEPSVRFLQEIGYYGLAELEFKRDTRDGQYKLLDFNARTWGYHSLGPAAGTDFPYLLFRDQIGGPVDYVRAREGVRWVRLVTDVPNAFVDIRAKRLSAAAYLHTWTSGVDVEAVFSLRDPLPWFYELGLLPYLAISRGL